jgi:hypothetical protein
MVAFGRMISMSSACVDSPLVGAGQDGVVRPSRIACASPVDDPLAEHALGLPVGVRRPAVGCGDDHADRDGVEELLEAAT